MTISNLYHLGVIQKYFSLFAYLVNAEQKYREQFEPFIEDDVPFDEYCQSMGKDATWAGHMELQAASLMTRNNICIHRVRLFSFPSHLKSDDSLYHAFL